jgi:ABC-2 type transport system ATP-binding protein
MRSDSGCVLIDGQPVTVDRHRLGPLLGLVPQSLALYPSLSGMQNVTHFARMQGLSRSATKSAAARVLEEVGLAARANDPMHSYSCGMQRRLNLACGVVHQPAVLLLDEPTVGVDLQSREQILTLVRRLAHASTAVIYSTHYMEEAERLCDRVLLIDGGRLIADGTVQELNSRSGCRPRLHLHSPNLADAFLALTGRALRDNGL